MCRIRTYTRELSLTVKAFILLYSNVHTLSKIYVFEKSYKVTRMKIMQMTREYKFFLGIHIYSREHV